MLINETQIRVRYAETDQMGFVYYGNYAAYYEVGRVETLRMLGLSYKSIEQQGFHLPVLTFSIKYIKPAYYDDLLTIRTTIPEMPTTRINFVYECYNEEKILLNKGETTLVFVNATLQKPCHAPDWFIERLKPYFR